MFRKILITILVIGLIALVARVLINPAMVSNLAVAPTLNQGEIILINRAERFSNQPLKRFELVAIVPPFVDGKSYEQDESPGAVIADLTGLPVGNAPVIDVRRVIALPGETIVVRKDLGIFIDGKLLDEGSYTKFEPDGDLFVLADITRQSAYTGVIQSYENSDAPIVVPQDMVFVLPDNRKEYAGSDRWGFLSQKRVIGKVAYKISSKGVAAIETPKIAFATEKIAINDDGVRALDKGEYTKAIHLFKSALAVDNNFELARDNLSIAYNNFAIQSAGKPEVALDSLHKALFLDPDNDLTKKNLAGILKRMGKDANKYEDRVALATDAEKHGKAISALVEYRAAVKLNPNAAILAKVSELESQCNFPAHAIPEDLVASSSANISELNTQKKENGRRNASNITAAQKPDRKPDKKPDKPEESDSKPSQKETSKNQSAEIGKSNTDTGIKSSDAEVHGDKAGSGKRSSGKTRVAESSSAKASSSKPAAAESSSAKASSSKPAGESSSATETSAIKPNPVQSPDFLKDFANIPNLKKDTVGESSDNYRGPPLLKKTP
jgi:signal peptidase I